MQQPHNKNDNLTSLLAKRTEGMQRREVDAGEFAQGLFSDTIAAELEEKSQTSAVPWQLVNMRTVVQSASAGISSEEIRNQFPALNRRHNDHAVACFDGAGSTQTRTV